MGKRIKELVLRYPQLSVIEEDLESAFALLRDTYERGGKLLVGGNGGSAADAEHIVGELMKGFCKRRPLPPDMRKSLESRDRNLGPALAKSLQGALQAIAITGHSSLTTAFGNDVNADMAYAQQVYGYGCEKDTLLCISTSGNAGNLLYAAVTAKAKGMQVLTLSGKDGGALKSCSDLCLIVPEWETFKIQELHLPIYHALCLELEEYFFKE